MSVIDTSGLLITTANHC